MDQPRVCGTRTIHGDCLFHRWIEEDGKTVGLVETKNGSLICLPWKWIYFYDSEKYFGNDYVRSNAMYSKKYRLIKIEEFNGHNPLYDNVDGKICYLAYLKPGERGWLLCEYMSEDEWWAYPHRIHTSIVKSVECTRGNQVIVATENTRFTFEVV